MKAKPKVTKPVKKPTKIKMPTPKQKY